MRKDWKYIAYLLLAIGIYLTIKLTAPREFNWTISYHHQDKNPFGAFALNEVIRDVFPNQQFQQSNHTPYEILDSASIINFLSISTNFSPGDADVIALLKNVERGGCAFIAAQYFSGTFADTLELYTSDYFFEKDTHGFFNQNDSSQLTFTNPSLKQKVEFIYPRKNIHNYFESFDSTKTSIVAVNDLDLPVLLKVQWGKGFLILNSTPLVFTNIYLLQGSNPMFVESSLSLLPNQKTHWTEYYQLGRMEIQTPLRFILGNEPLRWAYYISILSILIFMLFEIKRKQRIIPVIKPLANTTLEFVGTIGNLYYQSKDHKDIGEKRISFLLEQLRTKYGFTIHHLNSEVINTLARRTGNAIESVQALVNIIEIFQNKKIISEEELRDLNKKIEDFSVLAE